MAVFAQNFKLNILQATYGIHALAQQEILSFNEIFFRPSTAMFTTSKTDLIEFEQQHPELEATVKALLRSYEGIFDFSTTIYESLLAKFLRTTREIIVQSLKKLHQYGIVQYMPPTDKPQLYLIKSRMYSDDFKINAKELALRKAQHQKRLSAISFYINELHSCRSNFLADYFGAPHGNDCKICDNCINHPKKEFTEIEFEEIYTKILAHTKKEAIEVSELIKKMKPLKEADIWQALHFLQGEEYIVEDPLGFIRLKPK